MQLDTHKLEHILRDAGQIARSAFHLPSSANLSDPSPVTATDLEVHAFLKENLASLLPGSYVLSEEEKEEDPQARRSSRWTWIIDPIDGTKEFIRKIPEFAISVALVSKERPVLSALLNPATQEMGLSLNGSAPVFTGFENIPTRGHRISVSRTEFNNPAYREIFAEIPGIMPIGSVAYKLLRLAAGADDLYLSFEGKNEWDICGGVGLLEAAGMEYIRFDGKPSLFNQNNLRIDCGAIAGPSAQVRNFLQRFPRIRGMMVASL